jgi:hypothetical protein
VVDPIEGVVRGKGLHDELTGTLFAAMETAGGDTHYLQLDAATSGLEVGDIVRVSPVTEAWVKPPDQVIARFAAAAGGVYDPNGHLAQLEAMPARSASTAPAQLVAGNVRRLERLQRYGLCRRLPNGTWRIPADLVQQLESRERTHPRRNLRIERLAGSLAGQATYPGPTWLDRQAPGATGRAPWGFGAELADALSARASFLRARGLDRSSASFIHDMEATERTLFARQLARELQATHVEQVVGMHGTLTACAPLPSGRAYARVLDERAKRFVLVRLGPEMRGLEGRLVELSIDAGGRLSIRPARRLNRGDRS